MGGLQVRTARERLGWTQQQAARRWGVSQPYLSLMEGGKRSVPRRLARLLTRGDPQLAPGLPVEELTSNADDLPRLLGTLGYPGFAYLADRKSVRNPASVVLAALHARVVPARVTEALPWALMTFADLDWSWLLDRVKLSNLQNRLGYLVGLAKQLAAQRSAPALAKMLAEVEAQLEEARLAKEDTLGRDLTEVERRHLRRHRPAAAAHWNLLTRLDVDGLRHGG